METGSGRHGGQVSFPSHFSMFGDDKARGRENSVAVRQGVGGDDGSGGGGDGLCVL